MLGVMLTLGIFLTPIFYPPSAVPQGMRVLLAVNPMYALVEAYRSLILKGQLPAWESIALLASVGIVAFLAGYRLFVRVQPAFADVL
jgi:ABC-type polysaccharide/polyol phosphate export permease